MKPTVMTFVAVLVFAAAAAADQTTLTGQISDSMCKAKHEEAAEGAGKMADHDCTVSCVKGGSKYVVLADGKIYQIANQTFADVEKLAGQAVKISGDVKGDTITVAKIEAAK
jgi:archaellum component FlaG (FlaF/FlaG flagellin family)